MAANIIVMLLELGHRVYKTIWMQGKVSVYEQETQIMAVVFIQGRHLLP